MDEEVKPGMPLPAPVAVVELLGRDGRPQLLQRVGSWPARIGRSPACEVVLDDPHLAAEHAVLDWTPEGGVQLRLLPSLNGGEMAGEALKPEEPVAVAASQDLVLAGVPLRIRHTAAALAAEQPLAVPVRRHWALLPGMALLLVLLQWLDRWSSVDPDSRWVDYAAPLLGPLVVVAGWAALWALATQLFQHRFPFATHLRKVLLVLCAVGLLEWLLPLVAFAFSWPRLLALEALVVPVLGGGLVWWHASTVWPRARRWLGGAVVSLLVLGLGLQAAGRWEQQHLFGPPYLASLAPPAFRLASPKPPASLIDSLRPLQAELARQANKDNEAPEADPND
ncbi:FHA domain-containing protein [Roseateles sp.]|uniref:FHA domain-containing protein n=1 Tax=Roseateles sp. TaxID=1971397 RepID=UPI003939F3CD